MQTRPLSSGRDLRPVMRERRPIKPRKSSSGKFASAGGDSLERSFVASLADSPSSSIDERNSFGSSLDIHVNVSRVNSSSSKVER